MRVPLMRHLQPETCAEQKWASELNTAGLVGFDGGCYGSRTGRTFISAGVSLPIIILFALFMHA
jgi:hypothetical protein